MDAIGGGFSFKLQSGEIPGEICDTAVCDSLSGIDIIARMQDEAAGYLPAWAFFSLTMRMIMSAVSLRSFLMSCSHILITV